MAILPPAQKKVIVNADDFGLTDSVNEGIIACHRSGIVKSTSILANGTGLNDAKEKLQDLTDLGCGIHLTLVHGKPVSPSGKVSTLLFNDGNFAPGYPKFAVRYLTRGVDLGEVEYEWEKQREELDDVDLDHIDSHQHLHMLPGLFKLVVKLAMKWRIPWVRVPFENIKIDLTGTTVLSANVLNMFTFGKRCLLNDHALKTSDVFYGSSFSGSMTSAVWPKIWPKLQPGTTEIMCHPGRENEFARSLYGWANKWEDEYIALTDSKTFEETIKHEIVFTNFRNESPK